MSKQPNKIVIGALFAIGSIMVAYNVWADRAYSSLNAGTESGAFPFYHPIRFYGYLIESRVLDDPRGPIETASKVSNLIHGQVLAGAVLMVASLVLWVWMAVISRHSLRT
ncbi:MAG: hypothetical protein RIQ71_1839 [Verrucomicrobiota bacterium]|jgi:hypothetical protein